MYNPKKKREKFATQVDSELLAKIREIAAREGRQIQSVVDEAFDTLLDVRSKPRVRADIMAAYQRSVTQYDDLYRKLAQ